MLTKLVRLAICAFMALSTFVGIAKPKNIILFIGDGMGEAQIKATEAYFSGGKKMSFRNFPSQGWMTTHSKDKAITDSAAAATAMATGIKTNNGYVGRDPQAIDQTNIFELYKMYHRLTGIVTTVSISHATPAGFAAHQD